MNFNYFEYFLELSNLALPPRGLGRPTSTRNVVMAFFRHFSLKTTIESYFVSQ